MGGVKVIVRVIVDDDFGFCLWLGLLIIGWYWVLGLRVVFEIERGGRRRGDVW